MNRRILMLCAAATIMASALPQSASAMATAKTLRRRLGPVSRSAHFDVTELHGPLGLRASGNALWIEAVAWIDGGGKRRRIALRRNLPPGVWLPLPAMEEPRRVTIEVTALPLSSSHTLVELSAFAIFTQPHPFNRRLSA